MHDRSALGPADVTDEELTSMVADLLGSAAEAVEVVESHADEVAYDLPAITTAGRYWVSGTAQVDGEAKPSGSSSSTSSPGHAHPFFS